MATMAAKPKRTTEEWQAIIAKGGGRGNKLMGTKLEVWEGRAWHTAKRKTKSEMMLNAHGQVVWKSKSAASKKNSKAWMAACSVARNEAPSGGKLKDGKGVPLGGCTRKGQKLLQRAREVYSSSKKAGAMKSVAMKSVRKNLSR